MNFDYTDLERKITEVFGTKKNYAEHSKTLCRTSLTHKLKNRVPFTDEEIKEAAELLKFENGVQDIPKYFFTLEV